MTRAYLLADPAHKHLPVKTSTGSLVVTLPASPAGDLATVLCLETKEAAAKK